MTDDDVLLDSSSLRALQCMDYGYQDVILEEFQCQGHKSHHKVKSWKCAQMFEIKN